jgi:exopolysaccharide biosynthesis polyprenyl glycosylphosphotransferase
MFRLLEILIIAGAFFIVYRFEIRYLVLSPQDLVRFYQVSLLINEFSWIYLSKRFSLYNSKRFTTFLDEVSDVVKVTTISILAATVPLLFSNYILMNLKFASQVWMLQSFSLVLLRLGLRKALRYIRARGYNYRNVLIVGCNQRSAKFAQEIEGMPETGVRIIGFIDAQNGRCYGSDGYEFNVLGDLGDLENIVKTQVVDEVFIRLPIKSFYSEIEEIVSFCTTVGVDARIPTDLFNVADGNSDISRDLGVPVLDYYNSPKMNWQLVIKRVMDIVLSLTLLIAFCPLFVIIGLLVKCTSTGPVLFKQQRIGYNGRRFKLLKFRTMVHNAEVLQKDLWHHNEMDGPVFKMKNDPRVTPIGKILRRLSLDELPQLVNVLKGDMSLVGPRPPLLSEVNQYDLKDRRRLSMKPGMTGMWQAYGRNTISFEKWMEMDREYIDRWSLWLDCKILFKTIPAVLRCSGSA